MENSSNSTWTEARTLAALACDASAAPGAASEGDSPLFLRGLRNGDSPRSAPGVHADRNDGRDPDRRVADVGLGAGVVVGQRCAAGPRRGARAEHGAGQRADAGAKSAAGRPAVWIQRLKNSSGTAMNSRGRDGFVHGRSAAAVSRRRLELDRQRHRAARSRSRNANLSAANVQIGDLIRFSYRGEFYQLQYRRALDIASTIQPLDPTQTSPPGGNLPFQIYRRPIKSVASAVQLTDGVAIDLNFSGVDFNTCGHEFQLRPFRPRRHRIRARSSSRFRRPGQLDLVYIVPSAGNVQVFRPILGRFSVGRQSRKNPHLRTSLVQESISSTGKTRIAAGWASGGKRAW